MLKLLCFFYNKRHKKERLRLSLKIFEIILWASPGIFHWVHDFDVDMASHGRGRLLKSEA